MPENNPEWDKKLEITQEQPLRLADSLGNFTTAAAGSYLIHFILASETTLDSTLRVAIGSLVGVGIFKFYEDTKANFRQSVQNTNKG